MALYDELAATATELLRELGAACTLVRNVPPTAAQYDPATGTATVTVLSQTAYAVVFPYGDRYINGDTILASDQQAYMSTTGVLRPAPGDSFVWGGETWRVVASKPLAPALVAVLYEMQVRKG